MLPYTSGYWTGNIVNLNGKTYAYYDEKSILAHATRQVAAVWVTLDLK